MTDEVSKCGHNICTCTVGKGEKYCSEICREAGESDMTDILCDCGHSGCE